RIDRVATGSWSVLTLRLAWVPCNPLDESVLFVRVAFPQEATHLVVADANAFKQIFDSRRRILDTKGGLNPVADLVGVAETGGADLGFELLNLVRRQVARIALVVQSADGLEPTVAKHTKPFAQLRRTNAQQLRNLFSGFPRS